MLDKYSRDLAQSLHLGKWIVGVEKEKLSSHNVLFLFEFFKTTCMEYIFNFYKESYIITQTVG